MTVCWHYTSAEFKHDNELFMSAISQPLGRQWRNKKQPAGDKTLLEFATVKPLTKV